MDSRTTMGGAVCGSTPQTIRMTRDCAEAARQPTDLELAKQTIGINLERGIALARFLRELVSRVDDSISGAKPAKPCPADKDVPTTTLAHMALKEQAQLLEKLMSELEEGVQCMGRLV